MENAVLLLVVFLSLFVCSARNESEIVWLKDVTTRLQTDKRKFSDPFLPDNLTFQLRGRSRVMTLNLKRNHAIDPNADIYFVRKSNDGRFHLEKALNLKKEELAYYQDRQNGAFMTVKCLRRSSGWCDRIINGNILIEDIHYDLQPARNDVTSRDVFDAPNIGTRYILRDQANVEDEIVFTRTDTRTANIGQEVKGLFRRFPNGQEHIICPNSTLMSRKGSRLHKKDKQKNVYYVEMAVVLEQGIWNFYSSLMSQKCNTPVRHGVVEKKLREVYSHIINGVDLRYKAIEDPDIEIIVRPREFYIFQNLEDFTFRYTSVRFVKGKFQVDSEKYLYDLALWTREFSKFSDNVMLFTRYDLFDAPTGKIFSGRSYCGRVCDPTYKASIAMSRDYFLTVRTAAHELGHSLGADHDGEGNARACRVDDRFLMSPKDPVFNKTKPYSRHPWIFSNCSVEAFKDTLKNKWCLSNVAAIYNNTEWSQFMQQMPGQMYSPTHQCEMINGHGSVLCGNVTSDICHFMQCTDPVTKICLRKYLSAYRGTSCGENKWCMEGLCVSKSSK